MRHRNDSGYDNLINVEKNRSERKAMDYGLIAKAKDGDHRAMNLLIRRHGKLVVKTARQYNGTGILDLQDLISEGMRGLHHAIGRFNPDLGLQFTSYAIWWIKAFITRSVADYSATIRIPSNQYQNMIQAKIRLSKFLKSDRDTRQKDQDFIDAIQSTRPISMNTRIGEGNDTIIDAIADPQADPGSGIQQAERERVIASAFEGMPPREVDVLRHLYGLSGARSQTLDEVGKTMGVTKERVRQIREHSLVRMREILVSSGFNGVEEFA